MLPELLFYFLAYSFFGWVLENVYSFFTTGVFWKDGFMKGPYKPMYGVAPLLLLLAAGWVHHPVVLILLCIAIPTAVEYVSGVMLYGLFGRKWWDYSGNKGQISGHICVRFSLYWGVLSLVFLYYLHPLMQKAYEYLGPAWEIAGPLLFLLFFADLAWTAFTRRWSWVQGRDAA